MYWRGGGICGQWERRPRWLDCGRLRCPRWHLKAFLRWLRGVTLGLEIRKITIKGFDVPKLHPGNLHEWNGGRVLRLMMSKTRAGVSICLTAPAAAIIDKYVDRERLKLLPVHSIFRLFFAISVMLGRALLGHSSQLSIIRRFIRKPVVCFWMLNSYSFSRR